MTILLVASRRARRSRWLWVAFLTAALVVAVGSASVRHARAGDYGGAPAPDPPRPGPSGSPPRVTPSS